VESTPCGSPCKVMSTELLNPRSGETDMVTAEVTLPITAEAETGEADTLKSGPGGGGLLGSPPQLARTTKAESVQASFVICSMCTLGNEQFAILIQHRVDGHRTVSLAVVGCCVYPDVPTASIV